MYRQLLLERSDGRIVRASLRGALRVLNVLLHEFYGASDRDHGPTKLLRPCLKGSEFIGSRRPLCADRPSSTSSAAGAGLGTRRHRARHCSGACWMRRRHGSGQHVSRIYSLRTTDMTSLSHASVHEHEGVHTRFFFLRANGYVAPRRTRQPHLPRMYRVSLPRFCVRTAVEVFPTGVRLTFGHSSGFRHRVRTADHRRTAYSVGLRHRARTEGSGLAHRRDFVRRARFSSRPVSVAASSMVRATDLGVGHSFASE